MATKSKKQPDHIPHPSLDRSQRFALDDLIRKYGFRIWKRMGKTITWLDNKGKEVDQQSILRRIPKNQVQDALMLEDLYFKAFFKKWHV